MTTEPNSSDHGENGLNPPKSDGSAVPTRPAKDARDTATGPNPTKESATLAYEDVATPRPAAGEFSTGTVFGEYELREEIARGGMGVVYRAQHLPLNRTVALKMILSGQLASEEDVKRFFLDAEAAASLDHPGIVPIYEIGQHGGQHFFSMKYIEGGSLAGRLEDLRKEPRQALELLMKVARAVHHAHQRGILHRDLKPANILIDKKGDPLVSDFGLAKHLRGDSDVTNTGAILGTPKYMSPEQASGTREVTTAADIYSLGAMLYQILVGRPPHEGATPLKVVMKVLDEKPKWPREIDGKIDRGLELICMKCLERDPDTRYSSAAALAEDLEHWLAGESISVRPPSLGSVFGVWLRNNLRSAVGAAVAGIIAGFVLAAAFWMTALNAPMSAAAELYEHFPSERRPLLAVDVTPLEMGWELHWVWLLHLVWVLIALTSIGLMNGLLVRPTTRMAMIGSGVIAGLVASLVAFAVSYGWGSLFSSVVEPVQQDLRDITEAAFASTPDEAARGQRALLRRYPDLADVSPESRGNLVYRKVYLDQFTGIPIGLWLGAVSVLMMGMIPAISGTLIAGSLLQRKQRLAAILIPYMEIMGTASLACLFLVGNTVGQWSGFPIIAPPLHYQVPFYGLLFLASIAAYRCWNLPVRGVLHIVWILVAVLYFAEMGRTMYARQVAADLVEQGRLADAAIRIERKAQDHRSDAATQFSAAVLRARLGQWDRHAAHCREMLKRFARSSDPSKADLTAKACLLSPQVVELEKALRLANVATQEGKGTDFEPWYEFAQGLAAYRTHKYDGVEEHLASAEQSPAQFFAATATLLRSMTRRQLKRPQEADQLLQKAQLRYTEAAKTADKEFWEDRLIYEILHEEARTDITNEQH